MLSCPYRQETRCPSKVITSFYCDSLHKVSVSVVFPLSHEGISLTVKYGVEGMSAKNFNFQNCITSLISSTSNGNISHSIFTIKAY